ncbi:unnamed protein product [Ixodes hexagonus]
MELRTEAMGDVLVNVSISSKSGLQFVSCSHASGSTPATRHAAEPSNIATAAGPPPHPNEHAVARADVGGAPSGTGGCTHQFRLILPRILLPSLHEQCGCRPRICAPQTVSVLSLERLPICSRHVADPRPIWCQLKS